MFRYIKAMSFDRQTAVEKLSSLSPRIVEHVALCVIYGNSYPSYRHWIEDELATWLYRANNVYLKNNKKLKSKDYISSLFRCFGSSNYDAGWNIDSIYAECRDVSSPYPAAAISQITYDMMEVACSRISEEFSMILSTKNTLTKEDIVEKLHEILDPLCE